MGDKTTNIIKKPKKVEIEDYIKQAGNLAKIILKEESKEFEWPPIEVAVAMYECKDKYWKDYRIAKYYLRHDIKEEDFKASADRGGCNKGCADCYFEGNYLKMGEYINWFEQNFNVCCERTCAFDHDKEDFSDKTDLVIETAVVIAPEEKDNEYSLLLSNAKLFWGIPNLMVFAPYREVNDLDYIRYYPDAIKRLDKISKDLIYKELKKTRLWKESKINKIRLEEVLYPPLDQYPNLYPLEITNFFKKKVD